LAALFAPSPRVISQLHASISRTFNQLASSPTCWETGRSDDVAFLFLRLVSCRRSRTFRPPLQSQTPFLEFSPSTKNARHASADATLCTPSCQRSISAARNSLRVQKNTTPALTTNALSLSSEVSSSSFLKVYSALNRPSISTLCKRARSLRTCAPVKRSRIHLKSL